MIELGTFGRRGMMQTPEAVRQAGELLRTGLSIYEYNRTEGMISIIRFESEQLR